MHFRVKNTLKNNRNHTYKHHELQNSVEKACKNCCTKPAFQTQFFSESRIIKHNFIYYQIYYCVYFTANMKASEKQTQSKYVFIIIDSFS